MKYSFIVPVFNRPDEVSELLESLCSQTVKDFEVIIVEDGSQKTCKGVCDKFASILDLHYYYKDNSGPGQSRNYGAERSRGEWLIILDSDVVLPADYLSSVECRVQDSTLKELVAWGGNIIIEDFWYGMETMVYYSQNVNLLFSPNPGDVIIMKSPNTIVQGSCDD